MKKGNGTVTINKNFGFVNNCFIDNKIIGKYKLINGSNIDFKAIQSFNKTKKEWGYKVVEIYE